MASSPPATLPKQEQELSGVGESQWKIIIRRMGRDVMKPQFKGQVVMMMNGGELKFSKGATLFCICCNKRR